MKLVLIADVSDLGQKGEIIEVKPGYGRNYLIPQKLAKVATDEEIGKIEEKQKEERAKKETELLEKRTLADQIAGITLEFEKREAKSGKIFGSVDVKTIAKELEKKINVKLKASDIKLEKPIRDVGRYKVKVRLAKDIESSIKVLIKGKVAKKSSKK